MYGGFLKWVNEDVLTRVVAVSTGLNLMPDEISVQFTFANELNVSVIRNKGSYGNASGLFEATVFKFDGHSGKEIPVQITAFTDPDGIAGWLDDGAVENLLEAVSQM